MYSPRNIRRLRQGLAAITLLTIALFIWLHTRGSLTWLENPTADYRARQALSTAHPDPNIVLIDIDNASFHVLTAELGRWPWTRRIWAELITYLTKGDPKLILFDILFPGEEPAADAGFAKAIAASGRVLLPFAFTASRGMHSIVSFPKADVRVGGSFPGVELREQDWEFNQPTQALAAAALGSGSILGNPDSDGITRRLPLVERYLGRNYAAFWLAAALRSRGLDRAEFKPGELRAGNSTLPVDSQGNFVVRWTGTPTTAYRRLPLMEMVCSMQPEVCGPGVTRHPAAEFSGKIVLIGASAAGSYEVRPTPVGETAPGMFVMATAIDNILNNRAVRETPRQAAWLLIALMAALPALLVASSRSILISAGLSAAIVFAYALLCVLFYARDLWLPMTAPLLAAIVSLGANSAYRYFNADRELSRTRRTLEAYVSPQLVRHVMDNLESIRFDGQKRRLTILFSDVRGFTTLTEHTDPVELLKQLNQYLEAMTDIVFKYDGILDKFIGDGLMAHWGAFTPDRPNAELAARASLEMMTRLGELNAIWKKEGRPELDIGIGLNSAEVIFGNVGAGKKLDFTVIGDGVNLAARLEGANKEYATNIIISEFTRAELGPAAVVRPLGEIIVKGKTVPVSIFELLALPESEAPVELAP